METLAKQERANGLPDVAPGSYLVTALFAAGPTLQTPMGETPLDWPTILAYSPDLN